MAKLFKTISLEERLKASQYNKIPTYDTTVVQGSTNLQPAQPAKKIETASLKIAPTQKELESQLLKLRATSTKQQLLPAVKPATGVGIGGLINSNGILTSQIIVNSNFRSSISLADRLSQPRLGTTVHLGQYFLSDQYTNYIDIKQPPQTRNQGGQSPNQSRFDVLAAQGLRLSNGVLYSHQQISIKPFDSFKAQGIRVSNGILYSPLQVQLRTYNSLLLQGTTFSNSVYTSRIKTTPSVGVRDIKHGGIVPITSTTSKKLKQGSAQLNLTSFINFKPNRTSPVLNKLGYDTQTLNLQKDPQKVLGGKDPVIPQTEINQGSITLPDTNFNKNFQPEQGSATQKPLPHGGEYNTRKSGDVSPLLMGQSTTVDGKPVNDVFKVWIDWKYGFAKKSEYDTNSPQYLSIQYVNNQPNPNTDAARTLGSSTTPTNATSFIQQNTNFTNRSVGNVANYQAMSYGQIARAASNQSYTSAPRGASSQGSSRTRRSGNFRESGTQPSEFVTLTISGISFRAFITSFSDSYSITWNDQMYVGKQDTLKTFKGMVRTGGVAFKIAAFNSGELSANYGKLNNLVKTVGIGKPSGTYIIAPLAKLTVGSYVKNAPIIVTSIKYDMQPADYSWDIDAGVPMLMDVSVDFSYIGDITGQSLNARGNFLSYG